MRWLGRGDPFIDCGYTVIITLIVIGIVVLVIVLL